MSNPDGATLPAAFTGSYNCGTGYTGTWSVAAGASQTVSGIPTGNVCSVVETPPAPITGYTWGTITYTPATITILAKAGTYEIVVGNSITRDRGSLTVTKVVNWFNSQPDTTKTFTICIKGPEYPNGTEAGACHTFPYNGGSYTWPNIKTGTYVINEQDPGMQWSVSYSSVNVVVVKGQTATATVTNTQNYLAYTPGFWKNHGPAAPSGHNAWQYTDYLTTDLLGSIFDLTPIAGCTPKGKNAIPYSQMTLLDALSLRGGKDLCGSYEILLRHGTAALLNASINEALAGLNYAGFGAYPYNTQEVIIMVNNALASGSRTTVLSLASHLDFLNNGGSEYFDWTWIKPNQVTAWTSNGRSPMPCPGAGRTYPARLKKGYLLDIDAANAYYYLNVTGMTVSPNQIVDGSYGFYVESYFPVGATAPDEAAMLAYWAGRGVTAAAAPGTWQHVMWQIVNGDLPIFYLDVSGGAVTVHAARWPAEGICLRDRLLASERRLPAGQLHLHGRTGYHTGSRLHQHACPGGGNDVQINPERRLTAR